MQKIDKPANPVSTALLRSTPFPYQPKPHSWAYDISTPYLSKLYAAIRMSAENRVINPLYPVLLDSTLLRFYRKIKLQAGPLATPCHIWQGHNSGKGRGGGYARFSVAGKTVAAHIYIFQKHGGIRQNTMQLDHLCNNRACVNPHHLEQVSPSTNQARKHARKAI